MSLLSLMLYGLAGLAVLRLAIGAWGTRRWQRDARALRDRIEAARLPPVATRVDMQNLCGLPPVVQRFFRAALSDGQPLITAVSVRQRGQMNLRENGERWTPFVANQRVVVRRPGFDWDARLRLWPGLSVRVHDAYAEGRGLLRVALLGVVPLASVADTPGIAQGECLRFLAEAAWYPTALLPCQGVQWDPVDDHGARASLSDGPLTVSLLFRFDAEGLIESVHAESRERIAGASVTQAPWEGRFSNYVRRDGMQIPLRGEVAWLSTQGVQTYWRGTIDDLRYEFAA